MRILDSVKTDIPKQNHSRNIEIDAVKEELVDYSDKVIKDPRIKKYSRPSFSESEVKEKIEAHQKEKEAKRLESLKNRAMRMDKSKVLKEKEQAVKAGVTQDVPQGDVGKNDPNDSNTRSKLKEAVKMGSFNFSQKEREVLNQILNKDS